MMTEITAEINALFREQDPPDVEDVRTLRRQVVAEGGREELAEKLMEIEKILEGNEELSPEKRDVLLEERTRTFQLQMADREPFPELRYRVLRNALERTDGQFEEEAEGVVSVTVPDTDAEILVKSLYHWDVVSGED